MASGFDIYSMINLLCQCNAWEFYGGIWYPLASQVESGGEEMASTSKMVSGCGSNEADMSHQLY